MFLCPLVRRQPKPSPQGGRTQAGVKGDGGATWTVCPGLSIRADEAPSPPATASVVWVGGDGAGVQFGDGFRVRDYPAPRAEAKTIAQPAKPLAGAGVAMGGAGERGAVGFGARANLSNSWGQRRRRASPAPASGRVQDQPISSSFSLAHPRESFFQDQPAISSAAGPGRFEAGSRPVPGHFKAFSMPLPCRFRAFNTPFVLILSVFLSFPGVVLLSFLFHMRFFSCLFSGA